MYIVMDSTWHIYIEQPITLQKVLRKTIYILWQYHLVDYPRFLDNILHSNTDSQITNNCLLKHLTSHWCRSMAHDCYEIINMLSTFYYLQSTYN